MTVYLNIALWNIFEPLKRVHSTKKKKFTVSVVKSHKQNAVTTINIPNCIFNTINILQSAYLITW